MKRWQQIALGILTICGLAFALWPISRPDIALSPPSAVAPRPHRSLIAPDPAPVDGSPLVEGTELETTLVGGERHAYPARLDAGDVLHVVVDQHGVDVAVSVSGPGARVLLTVDGPNGPEGPEPIAVVAAEPGVHRLEVKALDNAVAGRYFLRVEALRLAGEEDLAKTAAMKAFARGEELRKQRAPEFLRDALESYQQAANGWETQDPRLQALALRRLGQVLSALGEANNALRQFQASWELYETRGNAWELVPLLNDMGVTYRQVGEAMKAQECYQRALAIAEGISNHSAMATSLNNLGVLHSSLGELQEALENYDRALAEWQQLGDETKVATAFHNVGLIYATLGRTEDGLDNLQQALAMRRTAGHLGRLATTLTAIGWTLSSAGDIEGALAAFEEALELEREVGNRIGEAIALDHQATTYLEQGAHELARASFRQALAIFRSSGSRSDEAHTLKHIGQLHLAAGDATAALKSQRQALAIFRRIGDIAGEASALAASSLAERQLGNLGAARAELEKALELVESVRGQLQSRALRRTYSTRRHGEYAAYIDLLMELEEAESGRGHAEHAFEASERARARSLLESLAEARAKIRKRLSPEFEARDRDLRAQINALESRQMELASEGASRDPTLDRRLRSLLLDYDKLQGDIQTASSRWSQLAEAQPLSLRQIQQKLLDEETLLLAYALGKKRSFLWVVSPMAVVSYILPSREDIDGLARQVHELLPRSHKPGLGLQTTLAAQTLSNRILGPAVRQLNGKRLLIVADGALRYLPFGALPVPAAAPAPEPHRSRPVPLLAQHEIVQLPSASVLAALRQELASRSEAPKLLAVVADPVFHPDDPRVQLEPGSAPGDFISSALERSARDFGGALGFERLPYSRSEAEAILALVPKERRFHAWDFEASRDTVLGGQLEGYRLVHFATHGLLNAGHPALSGIVLSMVDEAGRPRDGFLRVHELYDLRLPADLVVLSACRTALGAEVRGEGLMGLAYGFFYAGAARVLVSFWGIEDRASAELMTRFYRHMLRDGLRPAAALRSAQLSMLAEDAWQAPYYWAGFALQGDWR